VMQVIRAEVRSGRGPDLSVLQLRALAFLHRHPGAPLSSLAEHVGLTLPSMSSQVSGLVERGVIDRSVSVTDRRFVTLTLTDEGEALFHAALQHAEERLACILAGLDADELATVSAAMAVLSRVFHPSELASAATPAPDGAPEVGEPSVAATPQAEPTHTGVSTAR
jgi:DNA-binding MarR family transcriptional regulator